MFQSVRVKLQIDTGRGLAWYEEHARDWKSLFEELKGVQETHPQLSLVLNGQEVTGMLPYDCNDELAVEFPQGGEIITSGEYFLHHETRNRDLMIFQVTLGAEAMDEEQVKQLEIMIASLFGSDDGLYTCRRAFIVAENGDVSEPINPLLIRPVGDKAAIFLGRTLGKLDFDDLIAVYDQAFAGAAKS